MPKLVDPRASRTHARRGLRPYPALFDPLEPRRLFAGTAFPYFLTELGAADFNASTAVSINNGGDVVGTVSTIQFVHPFMFDYPTGVLTDLSTPLGDNHNAFAKALNNVGVIVGNFTDANGLTEAFLYRPAQHAFTNLSDHGVTTANGISNNNEITGADGPPDTTEAGPNHHAYSMDLADLTPVRQVDLDPNLGSTGNAISFGGAVFGVSYVASPTPGAPPIPEGTRFVDNTNFGSTPTDLGHGTVYATDVSGAMAGTHLSADLSTRTAATSLGAVWHDLGTLGGTNSEARGMNDFSAIVGFSDVTTDTNTHAFLYNQGHMSDLNDMIDPALHVTLLTAYSINNKGQIVGDLLDATHAHHGYILTPSDLAPPGNGTGGTGGTGGGGGGGGGNTSTLGGSVSANLPASTVVSGSKAKLPISFTVTAGNLAFSGIITSQLFLSIGTTIDTSSIPLTTPVAKNVKLKPHAQTPVKFSVKTIPAVPADGAYHVLARLTDPTGATATAIAPGTLTVAAPHIDLSGAFSKTPVPGKGGKTNLSFTVNNTGNSPAKGPLAFSILSSPDGQLADAAPITTLTKTVNITPGKPTKVTANALLPAGTYFLLIQLDPNDTFHDANPADNVISSASQIQV